MGGRSINCGLRLGQLFTFFPLINIESGARLDRVSLRHFTGARSREEKTVKTSSQRHISSRGKALQPPLLLESVAARNTCSLARYNTIIPTVDSYATSTCSSPRESHPCPHVRYVCAKMDGRGFEEKRSPAQPARGFRPFVETWAVSQHELTYPHRVWAVLWPGICYWLWSLSSGPS